MNFIDLGEKLSDDYYGVLSKTIDSVQSGYALEFGVATGKTLAMIADKLAVTGFDSFEGLPEDWRKGFKKGMFAGPVPNVSNAEIVIGLFGDTLPKWVEENHDKLIDLSLVHIDCDLYSSTVTVLDNIGPYLNEGVTMVFDEYHGYPGWYDHEYRAWWEYCEDTGTEFEPIGYGPEQFVLRIK